MYTNIRKCDNLKDGIQNKETVKIHVPPRHLTRIVGQAPWVPTVMPPVVLCSVVIGVCRGRSSCPSLSDAMVAERRSQRPFSPSLTVSLSAVR